MGTILSCWSENPMKDELNNLRDKLGIIKDLKGISQDITKRNAEDYGLHDIIKRHTKDYGLKANLDKIILNFEKEPFAYFENKSLEIIDTERFITTAGLEYSQRFECLYLKQSGRSSIVLDEDNSDEWIYGYIDLSDEEEDMIQKHIDKFHDDLEKALSEEINHYKKKLINNN
jgi:hypothetical protein